MILEQKIQLAQNLDTPVEDLIKLSRCNHFDVQIVLAANPRTPKTVLQSFIKDDGGHGDLSDTSKEVLKIRESLFIQRCLKELLDNKNVRDFYCLKLNANVCTSYLDILALLSSDSGGNSATVFLDKVVLGDSVCPADLLLSCSPEIPIYYFSENVLKNLRIVLSFVYTYLYINGYSYMEIITVLEHIYIKCTTHYQSNLNNK